MCHGRRVPMLAAWAACRACSGRPTSWSRRRWGRHCCCRDACCSTELRRCTRPARPRSRSSGGWRGRRRPAWSSPWARPWRWSRAPTTPTRARSRTAARTRSSATRTGGWSRWTVSRRTPPTDASPSRGWATRGGWWMGSSGAAAAVARGRGGRKRDRAQQGQGQQGQNPGPSVAHQRPFMQCRRKVGGQDQSEALLARPATRG